MIPVIPWYIALIVLILSLAIAVAVWRILPSAAASLPALHGVQLYRVIGAVFLVPVFAVPMSVLLHVLALGLRRREVRLRKLNEMPDGSAQSAAAMR